MVDFQGINVRPKFDRELTSQAEAELEMTTAPSTVSRSVSQVGEPLCFVGLVGGVLLVNLWYVPGDLGPGGFGDFFRGISDSN